MASDACKFNRQVRVAKDVRTERTYTRTPLLNSFLGSWTTPLMVTFSILNTDSTVAAKMNMMDCAICAPGHALEIRGVSVRLFITNQ